MNDQIKTTKRTQLRRLPKRGVFDRETIYKILDEGFVCHVAFAVDGQPYAIPTGYGRLGDALYLHGSAASRMDCRSVCRNGCLNAEKAEAGEAGRKKE